MTLEDDFDFLVPGSGTSIPLRFEEAAKAARTGDSPSAVLLYRVVIEQLHALEAACDGRDMPDEVSVTICGNLANAYASLAGCLIEVNGPMKFGPTAAALVRAYEYGRCGEDVVSNLLRCINYSALTGGRSFWKPAPEGLSGNKAFIDLHNEGMRLLNRRDWPAAARALRGAISIGPTSAATHYGAGIAARELGDNEAAVNAWCTVSQLDPAYNFEAWITYN